MFPDILDLAGSDQELVFSIQSFPPLEFCLLLNNHDLLLMDEFDQPQVVIVEAAIIFHGRLKVLAAVQLQALLMIFLGDAGELC
jgi:hypothetical protein